MSLIIRKRLGQWRRRMVVVFGAVGMGALIGAPLSYALIVQSPSKKHADFLLAARSGAPGSSPQKKIKTPKKPGVSSALSRSTDCVSSAKMHPALLSAASSQLRKLAQYEQVCKSGIASQVSFFAPTPVTTQEARDYAADIAAQLREFSSNGISPLVFLEPTTGSGLVDMAAYRAGAYDAVLDTYFSAIKASGINDAMMGTWVPFPEGNIPVWSSINPDDFAACVTKTVTYQKKYFPASKASIMLDTLTYPNVDSWSGGQPASFLPYLKNIPTGLIDSFGLQGFPWSPPANEAGPTNGTARDYLRIDLAAEAARTLHVQQVWFNTGTFGVKYANQASRRTVTTPEQRLVQLTDVVGQATALKSQGFGVFVHLFAEDKSRVPEGTDWSYWPTGNAGASAATPVFKAFVHDLQAGGIPLGLFDTDE